MESLSLGAGSSETKRFDLETNRRIAEFTFIEWTGNDNTRLQKIFKDFYRLAEFETKKRKELWVTDDAYVLKYLRSGSSIRSATHKHRDVWENFQKQYPDAKAVVITTACARTGSNSKSTTRKSKDSSTSGKGHAAFATWPLFKTGDDLHSHTFACSVIGPAGMVCYNPAHADDASLRPLSLLFLQSRAESAFRAFHVDRDDLSAKFWLDPVQLAANFGFRAHNSRDTISCERTQGAVSGGLE